MASRMLARRTAPALRHHLLSGSENATAAASTFSTKYAYAPQQQQRRSLRQRREFWTGGSFPDGRPGGDVSVTAVGLDGRLHRLNAPTGSIESTPHNLTDWIVWRLAKVPKGFENFFPRGRGEGGGGGGDEKKGTDSNGSKDSTGDGAGKVANDAGGETTTKDAAGKEKKTVDKTVKNPFGDFGKKKKNKQSSGGGSGAGGGGGGGGNPEQEKQRLLATAALLMAVLTARSVFEDDGPGNGREVTWSDFRNFMLEPGDVDRIVVVNKKTARVYLRPGSRGVPMLRGERGGNFGSLDRRRADISSAKKISTRDGSSNEEWDDGTLMDMGPVPSGDGGRDGAVGGIHMPSMLPLGSPSDRSQQQLTYHFNIGSVESFEEKLTRAQQELGVASRDFVPVQYANETNWTMELLKSTPMLLMIGITAYMLRGMGGMGGMGGKGGAGGGMGGIFSIGKSNAKKIKKEDVTVTFKDVAGCHEAKKEIMEFVDFLQDSTRFTKLGAKIPKGALLCGPPGTGKTLLAKAVAGEASVPFFSISGSDFIEMFVGVGPSRVRDLFKEARAEAPCIIFIDEIDAVGKKRGRGGFSGGNDERENTLNQLLVEMDGFSPSAGVVVLAGTNRVDTLDEALTRPGRFDRQIQVDRPDLQGRKEIFLVHLKGITLEGKPEDVAGRLAGLTPGFAGADIANICNEGAIVAARRKGESVCMDDFEKATDRIVGGLESNKIMSVEERAIVAHHEAGHAVAGWFLEHADPLLKVTIIPRTSGALGYAQYLPKEVFLRTQDQIMDIVCMALAGRAAEEVFFGRVTTGASNDLQKVTELVYSTIRDYGMNPRVGQLAFPKDPNGMPGDKPYSDATAEAMDEEARSIVDAAYQRTVDLITEKKDEVQKVAEFLLDKETITHDDIVDCIGPRPFTGDPLYQEFVSKRHLDVKGEKKNEEEKVSGTSVEEDPSNLGGGGGVLTPGLACVERR